ncbi:hypothetical protein ACER0C_004791 [Sarotherodon galilaeus]
MDNSSMPSLVFNSCSNFQEKGSSFLLLCCEMSQWTMVAGVLLVPFFWFGGLVHGEISHNFEKCLQFFYENTIPQGFSGEGICQRYKNEYRFATLYDKNRRIPLYSAYKLSPKVSGRPDEDWKIEPQLAGEDIKEMAYISDFIEAVKERVKESQAVEEDYRVSPYAKGHLAPNGHQETEDDQRATFTLTNAVPQKEDFNSGPWSTLEQEMLKFKKSCNSDMYVITGVIPYAAGTHVINNRVHIPEYLWTAYCCQSSKVGAAVGRNDKNSNDDIVKKNPSLRPDHFKGYDVEKKSLEDLEGILRKRLNMPTVSLFKNQCRGG